MALLVLRHGEAGMASSEGGKPAKDFDRELTDRGRENIQAAGKYLSSVEFRPDQCLVSPYIRTKLTWELVNRELQVDQLSICRELVSEAEVSDSVSLIDRHYAGDLMIVSHQPLVSKIVAWYLTGNPYDLSVVPLPPGGMAYLNMEVAGAGCASLRWLRVPPDYQVNMRC